MPVEPRLRNTDLLCIGLHSKTNIAGHFFFFFGLIIKTKPVIEKCYCDPAASGYNSIIITIDLADLVSIFISHYPKKCRKKIQQSIFTNGVFKQIIPQMTAKIF
jgi:hypothetical protein